MSASEKSKSQDSDKTGEEAGRYSAMTVKEILTALGTDGIGLSEDEAARRLLLYGANKLPTIAQRAWYLTLAQNFTHLFALLLWAGAALSWLAGLPELSWAIVVVIIVNGIFSFWQEYKAERSAEALQALLPRQVIVRRNGKENLIAAEEVVFGDILILTEGEAVPADARIIFSERLRLDISSLTGESRPVPRSPLGVFKEQETLTSLPNLVFAGTTIAAGRGEAAVFATGTHTEFGRIAQLTQVQTEQPSPLQKELKRVTRIVTVIACVLGLLFFLVGTMIGGLSVTASFIFAVGIIVANVPEGLLPTLTLSLALGVRRMAKRNVLVKRLSSVETLGATTIILTDKTGTLTENEMSVREIWLSERFFGVTGHGYEPAGEIEPIDHNAGDRQSIITLLRTAALCCDARLVPPINKDQRWTVIGDPTEAAILVAAAKVSLSIDVLAAWKRLAEIPFDSTRKRMTTIQQIDGFPVACVKGALNEILPLCTEIYWKGSNNQLTQGHQKTIRAAHDSLADKGLRVLAVALRTVDPSAKQNSEWEPEEVEQGLTLLGLIAMEDPPRPEVSAAIAACRTAGVRVVMVTGDDGLTAAAIGREIGLHETAPHIITGKELDRLEDATLNSLISGSEVLFARVSPEHKLRLVEICQRLGEVVAVTGDGVNDAPALRKADIGVAMGATGTDVAREAADMVLTDDNFASIVAAIEEGRAVYDNIRKFVVYIFSSNVPEMIPFVLFILFQIPLPLTIMQVLAVDVGTDLFPALALGAEKSETGVMQRPPRRRNERLLNFPTFLRAYAWLGAIEAVLAISGFLFAQWLEGWKPGLPFISNGSVYVATTTVTFAGIVMAQIGNAFACRSGSQSIFKLGLFTNRWLLYGIAVEIIMLLSLIYIPPIASLFNMSPLRYEHWLLIMTFGLILLLFEEGRKLLVRSKVRHKFD